MRIEQDMPGRLKVSLKKEDMEHLALDLEHLDYSNRRTREVLHMLLKDGGRLAGFTHCGRLLIEAFPTTSEGCILYFTSLEQEEAIPKRLRRTVKNTTCPTIFSFPDGDSMLNALTALKACPEQPEKCLLYRKESGEGYILTVHLFPAGKAEIPTLLSEFGNAEGSGNAVATLVAEHGILLSENVLNELLP